MQRSTYTRTHSVWVHLCILAFVHSACGRQATSSRPQRSNVLLVTIDTFRADRVGTGVAPTIDRLAESGIRFTSARSAVPLTLPSHTTILTGVLPPVHGVRENGVDALSDAHATIARLLKAAGYQTAAFVGAFVLDRRFGLAQGFDTYDDGIPRDPDATERLEAERPASAVIDRAIAWLDQRTRDQGPRTDQGLGTKGQEPFFVWIHLYDPHAPYNPPPEFRARTKTGYDDEIAYVDSQLARVLEWLRARGLTDRTLLIVAGDHGEGLGDHGERTHGMLVYDSTLLVPLIVSAPGHAAGRRDEAVSLADLAPTILHAAEVTPPVSMLGRDLLGGGRLNPDTAYGNGNVPADNGGRVRQRDLYSETEYPRVAGWSALQALTDGRWMTIRSAAATEVYDLQNDPRQLHDVGRAQAAVAAAMASRIDVLRASGHASSARTVSPEVSERLRSLGYVASSAQQGPASDGANPATTIEVWNAFEDALSALNAHKAGAVTALMKLAAGHPDAPVFQTTYARALKEAGQPKPALAVYRQAARRWPTDGFLLHDLSVAAREAAGEARDAEARALRDEARRANLAALALGPGNAMALNGLGLLAIDDDRPQEAVKPFEQATAIDPNNASYWANLGNARRAMQDRQGAEQAYRRSLSVDPRLVDAANGLGVLLVDAERPAEAATWFERALTVSPDFVEARLNLGIALQQSGDTKRAVAAYRDVLEAPARYTRERAAAAKLLASLGAAR